MMMTKELLQKFMSGSCSEQEQEYIYQWISNPDNKEEVAAMMKISWDKVSEKLPQGVCNKNELIKGVLERNNDFQFSFKYEQEKEYETGQAKSRILSMVLKVAAVLIVTLTAGLLAYRQQQASPQQQEEVVFVEKTNPKGRKSTIELPDGSRVKLNADSKLRYTKKFASDVREVILEGEAFFEVEHDPARPFIVRTGDISTTVLGTSFNVRAYAKSDATEVAVVTGNVKVKSTSYFDNEGENVVFLTPNKMVSYHREDRKMTTTHFNLEEIVGWKEGILMFKNADQYEIAAKLNSWYGVEVEMDADETVMNKRYTGKFDNNSLEYVLKAISYTSDMAFEIEGNKVKLKRK
jgi:ferric-dicitrate binding protein FerR (iron transport regulator)